MSLPSTSLVRCDDTHRLISERFGESVLSQVTDDADMTTIFELDSATNDRLLAEQGLCAGIGVHELLFGVPYARIVNAAFTHAHPLGGRFNGPDRGAWYAGVELATAQAEVAFHKTVALAEIGRFEDEATVADYLADVHAELHDVRTGEYGTYLDPGSYLASQALAEKLLNDGSMGIIYPSARKQGGTCIACFRPAIVTNVRRGCNYRFIWSGNPTPNIVACEPTDL